MIRPTMVALMGLASGCVSGTGGMAGERGGDEAWGPSTADVSGSYTVGYDCDDCEATEYTLGRSTWAECDFASNGAIEARFVSRFGPGEGATDGMTFSLANLLE